MGRSLYVVTWTAVFLSLKNCFSVVFTVRPKACREVHASGSKTCRIYYQLCLNQPPGTSPDYFTSCCCWMGNVEGPCTVCRSGHLAVDVDASTSTCPLWSSVMYWVSSTYLPKHEICHACSPLAPSTTSIACFSCRSSWTGFDAACLSMA